MVAQRRATTVIEADVARTIRAAVSAKLVITRILVCPDGMVSIETINATETTPDELKVM